MDLFNQFSILFSADYNGTPFEWFGLAHVSVLLFFLTLNIFLRRLKNSSDKTRQNLRLTLAIVLCLNEIAWHWWSIAVGRWTIQTMLPLHLCSLLVWASAIMLVTKKYTIYEFAYFLGIGGAIQAMLTPDIGMYGFPHFRFFQTFISHGLIITSAIYMTTVEGFRPTWRSLFKVALWTNIYVAIIFFLNQAIGSNYLNINFKPSTPSLLDLLPAWPVYVLYMELIGMITCLLLYVPFYINDLRTARR